MYRFTCININNRCLLSHHYHLINDNVKLWYSIICSGGNKIVTKVRKQTMFQYGATIGPARYPKFHNPQHNKPSMLPRPVVKSRPGNLGHYLLNQCSWLRHLCKLVEKLTIESLIDETTESSQFIQQMIHKSNTIIPASLRICETFFTQMIIVGHPAAVCGNIPIHLDKDDIITALLSIGDTDVDGGSTNYYEKLMTVHMI